MQHPLAPLALLVAAALAVAAAEAAPPESVAGEVRVVRLKAVADEPFREEEDWREEIRDHVEWSDAKMRELAGIGLELVAVEPWHTHESSSMSLLLDEARAGVDKGEADVVVGFSGHPPPVTMIHLRGGPVRYPLPFTAGIAFPLGDRVVVRRTQWKELTRHTLLHEIAHLFGALHVADGGLMETGTDRTSFRLDPFNRRVLELTHQRDFDRDIRDIPAEELEKIVALYREAPLGGEDDPDTAIRIGYLYMAAGEIDAALPEFERAMAIAPERSLEIVRQALVPELETWAEEHETTVRSRHMLGQAYFVAGQWLRASLELQPNCSPPVEHPPSCALLGGVLFKSGDLAGAEEVLTRAIRLDSSLATAHNTLASVHAAAGRYPQALESFERARELDPTNVDVLYNEGLTSLALGQPGPAEASFREVLRLRESHDGAQVKLALALARQDRGKDARRSLRELEKRERLPALVLRDMAEVYFLSGDEGKAFRFLQLAKKGGVDVAAVEDLMQKGRPEPREVDTGDLIEQARAYHTTGRDDTARELLAKAAEQEPENPWVSFWLGRIAATEGDRPGAEEHLRRALVSDSEFAPALYELARLAHEHGEHTRAVAWLDLYVRYADAVDGPVWSMRGQSHYQLGDLASAERDFKEAVRRRADDGDAFYYLGLIYETQGREDEAVRDLQLAADSRSLSSWRRADAHVRLARLLQQRGDAEGARHHAALAARLGRRDALP